MYTSPAQELVRIIEEGKKVEPAIVQRALPKKVRPKFNFYSSKIDLENIAYAAAVASFYDDGEKAFYHALTAPVIAKKCNEHSKLTHKGFFLRQKRAYRNRCAFGIRHELKFLEAAVDFSRNMSDSGLTSSYQLDPDPSGENAVRALEEAPREIAEVTGWMT